MRKVVIHKAGGYEQLRIEEHPDPKPGAGEVLVRVRAAGVNYADIAVRWGLYESAREYLGWPITPGFEFAGEVVATGSGAQGFKEGQRVFGVARFGAYASHVVVPARQLYALPAELSVEQAAGFPAVFLTAYHALFQNIVLRPAMKILVHSAAGGVGSALLQLGRIAGCEMIGVVGASHKIEAAKRFGASAVIDKSTTSLWDEARRLAPEGFDVVLDANGVETLYESYRHLRPTGKLIAYGFHTMLPRSSREGRGRLNYAKLAWDYIRSPRFNPVHMTSENKSVITFNLSFLFDRNDLLSEGMARMLGWLKEGKLQAPLVTAFKLEDVAEAHRALESGKTVGKLVLLTD